MTPPQHHTPGLASLPPELILRILDLADPLTQVSLACTSKYIAGCCHRQFLRLRAAYQKYGVSSDIDPATVPHLIRSALGYADPIDAWSVRSFELWGRRNSWDDWRPFKLPPSWHYTVQDGEPLRWSFLDGETEALVGVFKDQMSEEEQRSAENELRQGKDGFLKAMLLALLPRLLDVKIVSGACNKSLSWLSNSIQWGKRRATWPPGFAGIRDLAVGVLSGTWRDSASNSLSCYTLMSILQLPRLRTLQLRGLDVVDEEEEDSGNNTDRHLLTDDMFKSLSIERLILDDVHDLGHDFIDDLLWAPTALEGFALRGSSSQYQDTLDNFDQITTALAKFQSASIERFMLYNAHQVHGYRCSAYLPDELEPCKMLRHVCVLAEDVDQQALFAEKMQLGQEKLSTELEGMFADSLEVLVVARDRERSGLCRTDFMDTAIAGMVEKGCYKGLQAVFLDQLEMTVPPETESILFPKAMRAGEEKGVDVYTRTNRREKVHKPDLLVPLGKYDLMTGPFGREGKEGLELNLKTGEWSPGCNACGRCDDCLRVYPAELWDTIRPNADQ